jgi:hypothetical protein
MPSMQPGAGASSIARAASETIAVIGQIHLRPRAER